LITGTPAFSTPATLRVTNRQAMGGGRCGASIDSKTQAGSPRSVMTTGPASAPLGGDHVTVEVARAHRGHDPPTRPDPVNNLTGGTRRGDA